MLGVLRGSMMHLCGRFVDEGRVGREERDQDVDQERVALGEAVLARRAQVRQHLREVRLAAAAVLEQRAPRHAVGQPAILVVVLGDPADGVPLGGAVLGGGERGLVFDLGVDEGLGKDFRAV